MPEFKITLPPAGKHFHIDEELPLRAHMAVLRMILDDMCERSVDADHDDSTFTRTFSCSPQEWEAVEIALRGAEKALGPYTPDLYDIGKNREGRIDG